MRSGSFGGPPGAARRFPGGRKPGAGGMSNMGSAGGMSGMSGMGSMSGMSSAGGVSDMSSAGGMGSTGGMSNMCGRQKKKGKALCESLPLSMFFR